MKKQSKKQQTIISNRIQAIRDVIVNEKDLIEIFSYAENTKKPDMYLATAIYYKQAKPELAIPESINLCMATIDRIRAGMLMSKEPDLERWIKQPETEQDFILVSDAFIKSIAECSLKHIKQKDNFSPYFDKSEFLELCKKNTDVSEAE